MVEITDAEERGEAFAEAIGVAVYSYGPPGLTARQQLDLAHHLTMTACDWWRKQPKEPTPKAGE